jgi:uncharacterized protein
VKLRVDEITGATRTISFPEPEAGVNSVLSGGPNPEWRVEGPIAVALSYYRSGMELFFQGELNALTAAACARCADEFVTEVRRSFRYVLSPKPVGLESKRNLEAEALEFSLYEGEEIDLSPVISEQVLLSLPTRPLCREDCKGLCARCGANLNQGSCNCLPLPNVRWFDLSALKSRRGSRAG